MCAMNMNYELAASSERLEIFCSNSYKNTNENRLFVASECLQ